MLRRPELVQVRGVVFAAFGVHYIIHYLVLLSLLLILHNNTPLSVSSFLCSSSTSRDTKMITICVLLRRPLHDAAGADLRPAPRAAGGLLLLFSVVVVVVVEVVVVVIILILIFILMLILTLNVTLILTFKVILISILVQVLLLLLLLLVLLLAAGSITGWAGGPIPPNSLVRGGGG